MANEYEELIGLALRGDERAMKRILETNADELENLRRMNLYAYDDVKKIKKEFETIKSMLRKLNEEYSRASITERADIVASSRDFDDYLRKQLYPYVNEDRINTYIHSNSELLALYTSLKNVFDEDKEKLPLEYEKFLRASDSEIRKIDEILYDLHELIYEWKSWSNQENEDEIFEKILDKYNEARRILEEYSMPPEHVLMMREINAVYAYGEAKRIVKDYMKEYEKYKEALDRSMNLVRELNSITLAGEVLRGALHPDSVCKEDDEYCKERVRELRERYLKTFKELDETLNNSWDFVTFAAALREKVSKELGVDIRDLARALE